MELPYTTFYTRVGLASVGVGDSEIKRALRRGTIVALGHGAYADAAAYSAMNAEARHIMSVRAVASACSRPVVSHQSAAVIHNLAMWNPDLTRVHLSVDSPHHGRRTSTLHVHPNRLDQLVMVHDLKVTSVAKTVVDLARTLSFEAAVCVADSALHEGLTSKVELAAMVDLCSGLTGRNKAVRVVDFADGRSETVGESRSRVYMQRNGFAKPELQVSLRNPDTGKEIRPDLSLKGVIVEFDGKLKYTSTDALFAEKKREDELTSLGWVVVRWTWEDLATDAGAVKLRRGIERAKGLPPPLTIRI
ncbi:hypothetical protein ACNHUS_18450 [Actinomycetes bacterium M1A6_2h]